MTRIMLVHGAASSGAMWKRVRENLADLDVDAPERPCTGSLPKELDWLDSISEGAVVAGVSGGATLALGLAARPTTAVALIAHEPAVGSLVPELLSGPLTALAERGVDGFARALYGQHWNPSWLTNPELVPAEVAMFRSFEPSPALTAHIPVLVTTGALSSPVRHQAATRLSEAMGYSTLQIPHAGHLVSAENPAAFAALIRAMATGLSES